MESTNATALSLIRVLNLTTRLLDPTAARPPFDPAKTCIEQPILAPHKVNTEPSFSDLLTEPPHPMPDGRPETLMCFIERDTAFYREVEKLKHAVIIYGSHGLSLTLSQAVEIAVNTGLVRPEEIRVASLARKRTLIHLPRGLKVDTFIRALPPALWDRGFSIQPWSQIEGTEIVMPRFKVLLDLVDLPIHLRRAEHVSKAVSGIGVYLGSVPLEQDTDCSYWRVAVATNDLGRVPQNLTLVVGGVKHNILVMPVTWKAGPIYTSADFPPPAMRYSKPLPPQPPRRMDQPDQEPPQRRPAHRNDEEDMVHCSRKVLMEICKELDTIPKELRQLVGGRQNHREVPIQVLRRVSPATEDPGVDTSPTDTIEANQAIHKNRAATPTATRNRRMDPITPDLTSLFLENQPEQGLCLNAQLPSASEEPDTEADAVTQFSERQKDKNIANPDASSPREAGQAIVFKAQHDTNLGQSMVRRPQKINEKVKEGGTSRTVPKSTSTHMRFRDSLEKGKLKQRIEESVNNEETGRKKGDLSTKERSNHKGQPQPIPKPLKPIPEKPKPRRQKVTPRDSSKLIDVPVKLVIDHADGPNSGPADATPSKRKLHSNLTRPAHLIKRKAEDKSKKKEQASVNLNPEGFFKVQIDQQLGETIGRGCGIDTSQVFDTLQADNIARQLEAELEQSGGMQEDQMQQDWEETDWDDIARFDPDPEDQRFMEEDV